MTTRIKICGITRPEDAAAAATAGADFLGINFWPQSKRYVDPARASAIVARRGAAQVVGVFVDADRATILRVLDTVALDAIQLHGNEPPELLAALERPVWKALPADRADLVAHYATDTILLDTPTPGHGGSGHAFDWTIARDVRVQYPDRKIVLAGGLTPVNIAEAIAVVDPWAVDVASGVESAPGIKDTRKVIALITQVRLFENVAES